MKEKGIAVYKIPERLEVVAAIPRNPVGKILKKALREDIRKKMGAVWVQQGTRLLGLRRGLPPVRSRR